MYECSSAEWKMIFYTLLLKAAKLFSRPYSYNSPAIHQGKERVQLLTKVPRKAVDVWFVLCIVERNLPLLIINVYSHPSGHQQQWQCCFGIGACEKLTCAAPQDPITSRGIHWKAAMPLWGSSCHSNFPITIVCKFHFPVMAATHVALPA